MELAAIVDAEIDEITTSEDARLEKQLNCLCQDVKDELEIGAKAWITAGQRIRDIKEEVGHRNFLRCFSDHDNPVSNALPFGSSTGRRLIAINNRFAAFSNRAHVHTLPSSWGTLYELTKLDECAFAAAIEDGRINPEMQRKDVKSIREGAGHERDGSTSQASPPAILDEIVKIDALVRKTSVRFDSNIDRQTLADALEQMSEGVRP